MAIKIKGTIGVGELYGPDFADRISRLSGDIEFEIDSPGGSVFHGISIYNAIKNYNKGKCRMHVVGDCSSMAAYIMLAGDGPVEFEPNSIVVLHNPWSFAVGDYRAMQKEGKVLEAMSKLYAKAFVERGLFAEDEIRAIMDEETWFIGSNDLKKLGKVLGENSQEENDESEKELKIAACRERMATVKEQIRALKNAEDETSKIAALICDNANYSAKIEDKPSTNKKQEQGTQYKGENKMNLSELQAQEPKLYAEIIGEGVKAEQERVSALMAFIDVDKEATIDAIKNGKNVSDNTFQAAILMAKVKSDNIKGMESENPPQTNPKEEAHAPESEAQDGKQDEAAQAKIKAEKEQKEIDDIVALMGIND